MQACVEVLVSNLLKQEVRHEFPGSSRLLMFLSRPLLAIMATTNGSDVTPLRHEAERLRGSVVCPLPCLRGASDTSKSWPLEKGPSRPLPNFYAFLMSFDPRLLQNQQLKREAEGEVM